MIGYIRGSVTEIFRDFCFIETAGIGYKVYISDRDRQDLQQGHEYRILTYLAVREDAMTLYGFLSEEAYDLFILLISVSKIGPRVAMGILSAADPTVFRAAVRNKDASALTKLPGIGKKTAERLVLELADKMGAMEDDGQITADASEEGTGPSAEAAAALRALGYEPAEFLPVLRKLSGAAEEPAVLIRSALRELGRKRSQL